MKERLQKYAKFLVVDCLKVKKGQPLLVVGITDIADFMNLVKEEATKIGATVYFQMIDKRALRDLYLTSTYEECIQSPLLDRHLYNEIALQNGAFLSLTSPIFHLYDGVDMGLLAKLSNYMESQITEFRKKQEEGSLAWCIAGVANSSWAKELNLDEEALWNQILDICLIHERSPILAWNAYFDKLTSRCQMLNDASISSLHYTSTNGTDITFALPEQYVFQNAKDTDYIVNMPSLEIFTTPLRDGVNGIVYSTKPLFHNGVEIEDFFLRFEKGKIVEYGAKKNEEMLKQIIETDEGSHFLGEVALVDFDSKINQSGLVFRDTLFDENASCHLAIGRGFPECFQGGKSKTLEELQKMGMNTSSKHVDFMVGSRDLKIVATLQNGEEMLIMENGNLVI